MCQTCPICTDGEQHQGVQMSEYSDNVVKSALFFKYFQIENFELKLTLSGYRQMLQKDTSATFQD